jgi:hypothetical protein
VDKSNEKEFVKILTIAAEVFGKEMSQGLIKVYFETLKDISFEQVSQALSSTVKTLKWFPKPSEIRELALQGKKILADEAWAEVLMLKDSCCGTGLEPVYSSPMIEQAARSVGGLNGIWMAGVDQESYIRHAFVQAYNGLAEREHKDLMIGAPSREEAKQILNKIQEKRVV